jgi:heterotetrameric sarcosine oxidase delta subunit
VALNIPCPNCGLRPHTEFTFGGELREIGTVDPEADFARVYLEENAAGPSEERWFHAMGCRRWLTLIRDTRTNTVERGPGDP